MEKTQGTSPSWRGRGQETGFLCGAYDAEWSLPGRGMCPPTSAIEKCKCWYTLPHCCHRHPRNDPQILFSEMDGYLGRSAKLGTLKLFEDRERAGCDLGVHGVQVSGDVLWLAAGKQRCLALQGEGSGFPGFPPALVGSCAKGLGNWSAFESHHADM